MYLNPAYTGATENLRIGFNTRLQWLDINSSSSGIDGSFSTHGISIDKFYEYNGVGIGGYALIDNAGNFGWTNTKIAFSTAKEILFSSKKDFRIRVGGGLRLNQHKLNGENYIFEDALRNQTNTAEDLSGLQGQGTFVDASSGILISDKFFWVSGAIFYASDYQKQFLGNSIPLELEKGLQYTFEGGTKVKFGKEKLLSLKLFGIYRLESYLRRLDVGCALQLRELTLGIHYRGLPLASSKNFFNNGLAPFVGYKFTKLNQQSNFRLYANYSFDIASHSFARGGMVHELSIVLENGTKGRSRRKPKQKKGTNINYKWGLGSKVGKNAKRPRRYENTAFTLY